MNTIKCSGPWNGKESFCHQNNPAVFQTTEPISPKAKYTCKEHTGQSPDKVRLQQYQHDEKLGKSVGEKPNLDRLDRNGK